MHRSHSITKILKKPVKHYLEKFIRIMLPEALEWVVKFDHSSFQIIEWNRTALSTVRKLNAALFFKENAVCVTL